MNKQKKEIVIDSDDYTVLEAEFFDENYIIEPDYYNCRIDKGGQRFYVRYYDENNYVKAPSFSEVMHRVLGVDFYLARWMAEKGKEEAEFIKINSANYGTYLHVLFADIMRGKTVMLHEEWFFNDMETFFEEHGYNFVTVKQWYKQYNRNICDDAIGFICWLKEYNVKPIAMEYPLMHPDGLWAGTCDLICKLTIEEGRGKNKQAKEIIAMVDFKSTLTPFFEENEIQLYAYRTLWDMEHSDMKIERVYNYGCNSFKKKTLHKYLTGGKTGNFKPYQFKDQTGSEHVYKWDYYVQLYHKDETNLQFAKRYEYDAILSIDRESDLSNAMYQYDVIEGLVDKITEQTKVSESPEVQEVAEKLGEELKDA